MIPDCTSQSLNIHHFIHLFNFEFYDLVNTVKVMSSQSINLLTLFLARVMVNQYFVHIFSPATDKCTSCITEKGENDHRSDVTINLQVTWLS